MLNLVGAVLSVEVAKTISSGLVDDTKIGSSSTGLIGATWISAGATPSTSE